MSYGDITIGEHCQIYAESPVILFYDHIENRIS